MRVFFGFWCLRVGLSFVVFMYGYCFACGLGFCFCVSSEGVLFSFLGFVGVFLVGRFGCLHLYFVGYFGLCLYGLWISVTWATLRFVGCWRVDIIYAYW